MELPPGKKLVYCTYCGKAFTRKEHLERHIPTHTNVKPYLCTECGLGFSRRDLLTRHFNTYHQAQEPMDRPPGDANTLAGRNQIACTNCAQAKTGCDKQIPSCTRCREKNLQCEARFARRSMKAATRAKARGSLPARAPASVSAATPTAAPTTVVPALMTVGSGVAHHNPQIKMPMSPPHGAPIITIDPRLPQLHSSPQQSSPANSLVSFDGLPTPPGPLEAFRGYHYTHDASQSEPIFGENWPYSENLEFDLYPGTSAQLDYPLSMFTEFNSAPNLDSEKISPSIGSMHTRSTSIMSTADLETIMGDTKSANPSDGRVTEFDMVIAGDSAWPIARCNPVVFSGGCPRTAIIHLEALEEQSKHEGTWNALVGYSGMTELNGVNLATLVPTAPRTRDNMLAIAQTFLRKALDIHRNGFPDRAKAYANTGFPTFLVLPPPPIIDYFLQSYALNISFFYSLVPTGRINPNEMANNNQASALLVLLMIAQGASVVPREEARSLSTGLIETCRISLFDIIEKNIEMCADSTVHSCSLLFTLLGAWSGDKWLMDIAMGQRGMYLEMLKHAGIFGTQSSEIPKVEDQISTDAAWRSWLDRETKNRLVYNWVMIDQEISLFHDTAPLLTISDLCAPLPGPEQLWTSANPDQWAAVQSMFNYTAPGTSQPLLLTPSLHALYQQFIRSDVDSKQLTSLTPHQLRLLLHPLQTLLWHQQEMILYSSDRSLMGAMASTSTDDPHSITHEAQTLLQKWQKLSHFYWEANPTCVPTMINLVLFHLVSLNSLSNFPAIERLARRDDFPWEPAPQKSHYIYRIEEAIYHCGQVIRLVRTMPANRRPVWWSAAIYRAMLILWAHSLLPSDPKASPAPDSQSPVVIDHVTLGSPDLYEYMWRNTGTPVLSGPNGSTVSIDNPPDVLNYAITLIREGVSTRFSDGLIRKLLALNQHWST
ncbi:hypothetical protein F5Y14DRAFT_47842 [Nemania sp. NC0429]|nr:hypothetical protein F5Y14DRAFT_47842 [Nemania sp. NC0429]